MNYELRLQFWIQILKKRDKSFSFVFRIFILNCVILENIIQTLNDIQDEKNNDSHGFGNVHGSLHEF